MDNFIFAALQLVAHPEKAALTPCHPRQRGRGGPCGPSHEPLTGGRKYSVVPFAVRCDLPRRSTGKKKAARGRPKRKGPWQGLQAQSGHVEDDLAIGAWDARSRARADAPLRARAEERRPFVDG